MPKPTEKTIKRLFAVSNNQCAFPGCEVPIVEKSGTITGEICHIKAKSPSGPRYDKEQSDEERHNYSNLILLCQRHHTIIDSEPHRYTAAKLREMKRQHETKGPVEINPEHSRWAKLILQKYVAITINNRDGQVAVNSPGAIQAKTVNIQTSKKKVKLTPPDSAIASDRNMRTYAKYLIDRYNEFQKAHTEKTGRYKYIAIYNAIKREFKCDWEMVSKERFGELVAFLQKRIDNTKLGRNLKSRGRRRYHSFEEHPF